MKRPTPLPNPPEVYHSISIIIITHFIITNPLSRAVIADGFTVQKRKFEAGLLTFFPLTTRQNYSLSARGTVRSAALVLQRALRGTGE